MEKLFDICSDSTPVEEGLTHMKYFSDFYISYRRGNLSWVGLLSGNVRKTCEFGNLIWPTPKFNAQHPPPRSMTTAVREHSARRYGPRR